MLGQLSIALVWLAVALPAGAAQTAPSAAPRQPPGMVTEPPPYIPPRATPESPPLLLAPAPPPQITPPSEQGPAHSATEVIEAVLGLVVLFALAYVGGQKKVRLWERRLGISQVVTAGFPFFLLGIVAHLPAVGILSDNILWELRPLLALGLGWIGFAVGFRFDGQLVNLLSPGVTSAGLVTATVPFTSIAAGCGAFLLFTDRSPGTLAFLRDALLLGTAGAMSSRGMPRLLKDRGMVEPSVNRVWGIVQIEQLAAVIGLMLVAAYFRPQAGSVAWQLPGTAWLFLTIGVGAAMGGLTYATLARVRSGPEFTLLMLGTICFTAGMAGFLRLSPVVVCFIAAVILVNLPGGPKEEVRAALVRLERPIYLVFLLIAGSLWQGTDWQAWLLMIIFVAMRLAGKWLSLYLCRLHRTIDLQPHEAAGLLFAPMGALSVATVVNAQDLYSGPMIPWIVTAVIGGTVLLEVIVQWSLRTTGFAPEESVETAVIE